MDATVWDLLHHQAVRMYHLYEGVLIMQTLKQMSIKGLSLFAGLAGPQAIIAKQ